MTRATYHDIVPGNSDASPSFVVDLVKAWIDGS